MKYSKKEIDDMWKQAKKGTYYDNDEIEANGGSLKKLKRYDFHGNEI